MKDSIYASNSKLFAEVEAVKAKIKNSIHNESRNILKSPSSSSSCHKKMLNKQSEPTR